MNPMITEPGLPLLTLLILTVPVGALLIWLVPDPSRARAIALGTALVGLALALVALFRLDPADGGFQFLEHQAWIPSLNIHYTLGVDGISVGFLPLTTLLMAGVILASWTSVRAMPRLYYSLLLLLEGATLGVFCALDTMLFFLFWELTLVPIFFLVSLWGLGPNRRFAAAKYTLFMLVGGVPLLFAFVLLAFNHADFAGSAVPAGLSFDYRVLRGTPLPPGLELTVFLLLLGGFAVKTPVVPLHTWLPVVATDGPVAVAALMTGLKLGAYGLIRFAVPLAPQAAADLHWLLAGLGVLGMLYGALGALAQTNLRRMLAFSSVSHVGLVVLGIASLNLQGIQGAVFQLLNFSLISGGLFLIAGFLHQRTGTTEAGSLGGVSQTMPLLAGTFLFLGLASLGLPGTSGFPAELLLILSALATHTGAGLAALFAAVLGAGYFLGLYRRAFLGPVTGPLVAGASDLVRRELAVAGVAALLVLALGLYPQGVLDLTQAASARWAAHLPTVAAPAVAGPPHP